MSGGIFYAVRCAKCRQRLDLGVEYRTFLWMALGFAVGAVVALFALPKGYNDIACAARLLFFLFTAGAIFTERSDATAWDTYEHHFRCKVCDRCKHVNPVWPLSF